MKNVITGILLTPKEAEGVADILRLIAYMGDYDEIVSCDIEDERKSAKRLYNRLHPLLATRFIGVTQEE